MYSLIFSYKRFYFFTYRFFLRFLYFSPCWVFAATGFLWLWRAGAALQVWSEGFSSWRLLLLQNTASGHMAQSWWLSGSGALAQYLWYMSLRPQGMWDLPGPGIKPVSPGLAARFLTTGPPGKPSHVDF